MKKWKISLGKVTETEDKTVKTIAIVKNKLLAHGCYEIRDTDGNTYLVKRSGFSPICYDVYKDNQKVLGAETICNDEFSIRPAKVAKVVAIWEGKKYEIVADKNCYRLVVDGQQCGQLRVGRLVHCDVAEFSCDLPNWTLVCIYVFAKLMLHEDDMYVA